jgi:hypothetical protein
LQVHISYLLWPYLVNLVRLLSAAYTKHLLLKSVPILSWRIINVATAISRKSFYQTAYIKQGQILKTY